MTRRVLSFDLNMNKRETIYADYQATTPVDERVLENMAPCWARSFGNPHSSDHVVGWRAGEAVRQAAESVAGLIGADADEVVFTSGATESNNLALLGLARRAPDGRNRILVSAIEHKCVLGAARALAENHGISVDIIPVDPDGFVDLEALEECVDDSVLLVSVMAVNNEVGTIQDIPRIAELLPPHGIVFHCDAAQAPCAMDVSDFAAYADLISLSAHKFYGPQGIGALYIRRDLKDSIEPMIYGGGQQEGLRSGTVPMPLCVGMGAAAEIIASGEAKEERKRVAGIARFVHSACWKEGGFPFTVNGPIDDWRHPGNANVCLKVAMRKISSASFSRGLRHPPAQLVPLACPNHRTYSGRSACRTRRATASIRFSFGRFTSHEEIETAARLVNEALATVSAEAIIS